MKGLLVIVILLLLVVIGNLPETNTPAKVDVAEVAKNTIQDILDHNAEYSKLNLEVKSAEVESAGKNKYRGTAEITDGDLTRNIRFTSSGTAESAAQVFTEFSANQLQPFADAADRRAIQNMVNMFRVA